MSDSTPHILCVEDNAETVLLLQHILRKAAIQVTSTNSGEAALNLARQKHYDLVLLDVNMPIMNGFELCRHFKRDPALADIPIIILTVSTEPHYQAEAYAAGACNFFLKTNDLFALPACIKSELALHEVRKNPTQKKLATDTPPPQSSEK